VIRIERLDEIVDFLKDFLSPTKVWSLPEFINDLAKIYEFTRARFTKGGYKTS
jgi:hypothetical protein